MHHRNILIMFTTLLIVSCGHANYDLVMPPETSEDNRTLVMVYRDGTNPGVYHWVGFNDNLIARLKEKEYTEFYLPSGTQEIITICTTPMHQFDTIMGASRNHWDKAQPVLTKNLDMCYVSEEPGYSNDNCRIKLSLKTKEICDQKRKQLNFSEPGKRS